MLWQDRVLSFSALLVCTKSILYIQDTEIMLMGGAILIQDLDVYLCTLYV